MLWRSIIQIGLAVAMSVNSSVVSIAPECRGDVIIASVADMNVINKCATIYGSLTIDSNFNNELIDLADIESITEDLVINQNHHISEIRGSKVSSVAGTFRLQELTNLFNMELPNLHAVNSIEWSVLPILSYANTLPLKVNKSVVVSDTSLQELDLRNVAPEIEVLDINNNRYIYNLSVPVERIEVSMHLVSNGEGMTVDLANLTHVRNMTLQHLGGLKIHQLEAVENSMAIISNKFGTLNLSKLRRVGGTLFIATNAELASIEANHLEDIRGGFVAINNSKLYDVDGFKQLTSIGGALHVEGPIENLGFDSLRELRGSALIKATSGFDCDAWLSSEMVTKIRGGAIRCESNQGHYTSHDDEEDRHITQESGPVTPIATEPARMTSIAWQLSCSPWLYMLIGAIAVALN
ncbi:hypothetical protein DIURU_003398 [Diutina rugosa]|uniref:Receptor L-domain domain-containing protein n=1 Tax=Diutina rugosa TaxID=5481 RepID=A0A642UKZ8_DIURU|nr:uncharacterized protein DIURU_003398 [Diutina rugosa]KAA8901028.1 hypothetical protein DIURU_003398 [Diutina rugosa]